MTMKWMMAPFEDEVVKHGGTGKNGNNGSRFFFIFF
jgi:hypothetical protein